jgi:hypothetical protein
VAGSTTSTVAGSTTSTVAGSTTTTEPGATTTEPGTPTTEPQSIPVCHAVDGEGNTGNGYDLIEVGLAGVVVHLQHPGDLVPAPNRACLLVEAVRVDVWGASAV